MAQKALSQETTGASALDLHLSRPGRDEAEDLARLASLLAPRAKAALSLDSSDPSVLAKALPYLGGRAILNSASLEDAEKARAVFSLAAEFGAAVICLALDEAGPAKTIKDKVRVCRNLYDMATGEFDLSPEDLFFDPLTFTIAAGGDAATTIAAIGEVKKACPGSFAILGVGNISYGLPRKIRSAVTSLFLQAAKSAGLDAAILDTGGIPSPKVIAPALRVAALCALGLSDLGPGTAGGASEAASVNAVSGEVEDRLGPLLEYAASLDAAASGVGTGLSSSTSAGADKKPKNAAGGATEASATGAPTSPEASLAAALSRGDQKASEKSALALLEAKGHEALMGEVTAAMAESGRLWAEGKISLPLVLRSAEAARKALAPLADLKTEVSKGKIVMATVKGDLHDIGKNIVAAILACSGWEIVDLGTDVPTQKIIEASRQNDVVAVGLSGLLTRSLGEMKKTCAALHEDASDRLVLCGGAAVDPRYVEKELEPQHPGLVLTCKDAFEASRVLETFSRGAKNLAPKPAGREPEKKSPKGSAIIPSQSQAYHPAATGAQKPLQFDFGPLAEALNAKWLFHSLWAYRSEEIDKAKEELRRLLTEIEPILKPSLVYGHFPCRRLSGEKDRLLLGEPGNGLELVFPREEGGFKRSLADYFHPEGDMMPIFAVTIGKEVSDRAARLKEEGKYEEYWKLHGLGSALAEAAARLAHEKIEEEIRAAGGPVRARRYSFGFPACPGTEYQRAVLDLLGADRINLDVTSGHQLVPEHSITAFMVPREDAAYFDA
jgi:5-methyltetrahydrofolate--homocysteine methyltransferase